MIIRESSYVIYHYTSPINPTWYRVFVISPQCLISQTIATVDIHRDNVIIRDERFERAFRTFPRDSGIAIAWKSRTAANFLSTLARKSKHGVCKTGIGSVSRGEARMEADKGQRKRREQRISIISGVVRRIIAGPPAAGCARIIIRSLVSRFSPIVLIPPIYSLPSPCERKHATSTPVPSIPRRSEWRSASFYEPRGLSRVDKLSRFARGSGTEREEESLLFDVRIIFAVVRDRNI